MTRISIVNSWLCATGVTVVASFCMLTNHPSTPQGQKQAVEHAARLSRQGTIADYKAASRHSSAIAKKTTAKVVAKNVKKPVFVPNPLYPAFARAQAELAQEYADCAQDGEVTLTNKIVLALKDGKPNLKFPEEYAKVGIGGVAIGDELADANGSVHRKRLEGTGQKIDDIGLNKYRRLNEPEFYCMDVTYSALPSTKQVDAIRMHGNLVVGDASNAYEMVNEIEEWMENEYGAEDLKAAIPSGALALKKYRIGEGLEVEVRVNWKRQRTADGCDADINIAFTTSELAEENRYQRQKLGEATDAARASTLNATGVNYFSVRPMVREDAVKNKIVY